MGIPSLNIGIKIKFDFPFLCHHFDDIVQYAKSISDEMLNFCHYAWRKCMKEVEFIIRFAV